MRLIIKHQNYQFGLFRYPFMAQLFKLYRFFISLSQLYHSKCALQLRDVEKRMSATCMCLAVYFFKITESNFVLQEPMNAAELFRITFLSLAQSHNTFLFTQIMYFTVWKDLSKNGSNYNQIYYIRPKHPSRITGCRKTIFSIIMHRLKYMYDCFLKTVLEHCMRVQ